MFMSAGFSSCNVYHIVKQGKNKVLRKIFGAKRDEVTGEWRKLQNTELHALYSSPDMIRNIKSRRLRWAGQTEFRNAYSVLVGRPEGKRPLGRPRRRWEDNIKMDLREVRYDDKDWINLAQDRDQWRAYVRAAMNLRVNQLAICTDEDRLRVLLDISGANMYDDETHRSENTVNEVSDKLRQAKALLRVHTKKLEMLAEQKEKLERRKNLERSCLFMEYCLYHKKLKELKEALKALEKSCAPSFEMRSKQISHQIDIQEELSNTTTELESIENCLDELQLHQHFLRAGQEKIQNYSEETKLKILTLTEEQSTFVEQKIEKQSKLENLELRMKENEQSLEDSKITYEECKTKEEEYTKRNEDDYGENEIRDVYEPINSRRESKFKLNVNGMGNVQECIKSIRQNASYEVYEEVGCVSSDGSTRRADIIIIDWQKDKGVILDPTIRFEMHEQQPQEVCREKQVIYEPCCQHLGAQYHITHWTVSGLMFGARGTIPRET
ncbi:hypothetical protein ANN_01907 [Periplaneta americana]|uniref:Uncharacterized protein n=1 Tax=Periplaneta americana TaxID=6978 RepID=A0ABQ8TXS9_PERAM|nr:hypothetical protein ANN_01907 [Periplaneta americana]